MWDFRRDSVVNEYGWLGYMKHFWWFNSLRRDNPFMYISCIWLEGPGWDRIPIYIYIYRCYIWGERRAPTEYGWLVSPQVSHIIWRYPSLVAKVRYSSFTWKLCPLLSTANHQKYFMYPNQPYSDHDRIPNDISHLYIQVDGTQLGPPRQIQLLYNKALVAPKRGNHQ